MVAPSCCAHDPVGERGRAECAWYWTLRQVVINIASTTDATAASGHRFGGGVQQARSRRRQGDRHHRRGQRHGPRVRARPGPRGRLGRRPGPRPGRRRGGRRTSSRRKRVQGGRPDGGRQQAGPGRRGARRVRRRASGQLDVLFNNAGFNRPMHLLDVTEENWHSIMDVNALGTLIGIQEGARRMIPTGPARSSTRRPSPDGRATRASRPTAPASSRSTR